MPKSRDEILRLDEIAERIKFCRLCPLYETRNCAVPGKGNYEAEIVFIGEAPGKKEDMEGVPFVGAAGKFLNEMLGSVKMNREEIFITNVVKCRPPENRDPTTLEVKTCSEEYLWKQLELIMPKLVVTLGRHAMHRFLPADRKISEDHGKLFNIKSPVSGKIFNILPLYHPAAALYNGGMRGILADDFKKIPEIIKLDYKDKLVS